MIITVVKKRQFRVVIRMVKKGQFRVVKKGQFSVVVRGVKRDSLGWLLRWLKGTV